MRIFLTFLCICLFGPTHAQSVEAARNLRAGTLVMDEDISVSSQTSSGAYADPSDVLGKELRIAVYAGTPLRPEMLREPAIVERNQIISLAYRSGPLEIRTEGRALERGAAGDVIRVMNLASKAMLQAQINTNGDAVILSK